MSEPRPQCWCVINHPQTPAEREQLKTSLAWARRIGDGPAIWLCLAMLLGPCPAWITPDDPKEKDVNEIMRALAEGATPEEALDRETLRLHVCRAVTCPIKRTVLDLKRAVLVEINGGGQVLSGEAWDELGPDVLTRCAALGFMPRVVDARHMLWGDQGVDPEELGVYRDVLSQYPGEVEFARWCAARYPWGSFSVLAERQAYELLRLFAPGDSVRLRHPWENLPEGTTGRTVGRPYENGGRALGPVQFIELADRRRVVVPLGHLTPDAETDRKDKADG